MVSLFVHKLIIRRLGFSLQRSIPIHKRVFDKIRLQIKRTASIAQEIQEPLKLTFNRLSELLNSFDKYTNGNILDGHVEVDPSILRQWVDELRDLAHSGENLLNTLNEILEDVRDREDDLNLYLAD